MEAPVHVGVVGLAFIIKMVCQRWLEGVEVKCGTRLRVLNIILHIQLWPNFTSILSMTVACILHIWQLVLRVISTFGLQTVAVSLLEEDDVFEIKTVIRNVTLVPLVTWAGKGTRDLLFRSLSFLFYHREVALCLREF